MKFKPILKKAINGGMAVSMLCMTFTPLSKMQLEPFDVYAAVREIYQFQQVKQYNNNFSDVGTSDWFYNSVAEAYKYDLVNGKSATKFDPKGNVTIAEVITMADKLHSYSTSGSLSPSIQMEAEPWYTLFVRYAETMQIISTGEFSGEYDRPATREELAHIFAHAIPDNGYQQINVVTKLPDIDSSNKYYNDVIKLYNAGIISGNDYRGTFTPKANITRAEAAAIASRLALPSTRVQLTFCQSIALPPEDNSFGELKKIGTEVISREERDKQRAEEQKQQQTTTTANATTTTTNSNSSSSSSSSNKSSNNDSRYNYNYTWDYETNSPVDPEETRRLQREHGYNNTTATNDDDDRKENTSSNKSSSKEDREDKKETPSKEDRNDRDSSNSFSSKEERNDDIYWEFDGKIYYTEEEWKAAADAALDKSTEKAKEEDKYNIKHYAEGTLELVNEARAEEGLPALTLDPDLVEVAEIRAKELSEYFSHKRPNGDDGTDLIDDQGCDYFFVGENIAKGTSSAINIQAWLSSSGHRKAIMGEKYQYYGAAKFIDSNGTAYAVQVFGGLANP